MLKMRPGDEVLVEMSHEVAAIRCHPASIILARALLGGSLCPGAFAVLRACWLAVLTAGTVVLGHVWTSS